MAVAMVVMVLVVILEVAITHIAIKDPMAYALHPTLLKNRCLNVLHFCAVPLAAYGTASRRKRQVDFVHSLLIGTVEQIDNNTFGARITSTCYHDLNWKSCTHLEKKNERDRCKSSLRGAIGHRNCNGVLVGLSFKTHFIIYVRNDS